MALTQFDGNWDRLEALFHEALSLPPAEARDFCNAACDDDAALREFLLELVESAASGDATIRASVTALAKDVSHSESLAGQRIGAYQVDALLARGGMGEVYLASRADGQFEKQVVVKVIRKRLNSDEVLRDFKNERQVLAALNHPFIPAIVDAGQLDDGRPYFVGEYIDGVPITQWCDERRLSPARRVELIENVARAVQHAHNKLVLHLDIKPDNILIAANGTPRLVDFGIARLIGEDATGSHAFTPSYASPEQLRGEAPTVASDIYSLGVLMYVLLAGETPFSAPRFAPVATKIAERKVLAERIRCPESLEGVDPDLAAIVRKAMAEDSDERYSSIEAMRADLSRFREKRPVEARQATLMYRLQRFVARNAVAVAIGIGVFALLLAFGLREATLRKQAQAEYQRAELEAETAHQVSMFLTDLFEVSDPGEARGNSVTARELLDKGAERVGVDLATQPLVSARMMSVIGTVYVKLGLYGDAESLLVQARELRESALDADDAELANTLNQLGDVYRLLGRFDDAAPVLQRALATRERLFEPTDPAIAESLQSLGHLFMRQGHLDEAEAAHLRGVEIHKQAVGPEHPDFASHLRSLAIVYGDQGRHDEAEALYLRAIDILERAWGAEHPDLANYLESLGNLYNASRRFDDAAGYLQRALALREKALEPDHPLLSYSLLNLSVLHSSRGDPATAEGFVKRAIEIQQKAFEPDDYRLALSRYNLGEIYIKLGRVEAGEAEVLAALDAWRGTLEPDHYFIGYGNKSLAELYFSQGLSDRAAPYYERAFGIFSNHPADDPIRIEMTDSYRKFLLATGHSARAAALDPGPDSVPAQDD